MGSLSTLHYYRLYLNFIFDGGSVKSEVYGSLVLRFSYTAEIDIISRTNVSPLLLMSFLGSLVDPSGGK